MREKEVYKDAKISPVYMVVVPSEAPVPKTETAETAQTLPAGASVPARAEVMHV